MMHIHQYHDQLGPCRSFVEALACGLSESFINLNVLFATYLLLLGPKALSRSGGMYWKHASWHMGTFVFFAFDFDLELIRLYGEAASIPHIVPPC